ncbi:hypothetical protein F8388_001433 [Cannabis sativa]|uniref:Uncharacterized protein n=1 Tax=Cannabis sativa TaxID=3483 RepID=A0A7J6GMN9_CANSA|nr:hypothetical protein F8388_001433 [Cannabis sativa]
MELSSVCNFSFQTNYHTLLNPHNKNPKSSLLSYQHPKTPIITSSYNNFPSKYCSNKNFHLQNRCSKSLLIAKNSIRTDVSANQTEPPESNTKYSVVTKILNFGHTCWKLQRPYTFIGVISCACGLFGRELFHNTNLLSWSLMLKAFSSLMVILSVNLCTNIINQITDLDIDRINKPDLPLASGEMSIETAWIMSIIVALTGLILTIKLNCGPLFISLYCVSILVGALYSVPPFRWKQNPNTAFSSYFMGLVIVNFTCYYASRAAFGLPFEMSFSPPFTFILAFVKSMGSALFLCKDVSDIEGDSKHGISTLATRYGAKNITFLCSGIVLLTYVSAILAAIIWPQAFKSNVMLLSHATLAFWLIFQTREFALTNYNPEAGRKFYEFMWKLYYAEYLVYVFI